MNTWIEHSKHQFVAAHLRSVGHCYTCGKECLENFCSDACAAIWGERINFDDVVL